MKTFKLTHEDLYWTAKFEVDPTHENYSVLKDSLEFFYSSGVKWEDEIETAKEEFGDYALFVVWAKRFAGDIILLAEKYNLRGIKEEFADMEGHIKIDGFCGVNLTQVDNLEFSMWDFAVEKVN